jgi:hypothetical protein
MIDRCRRGGNVKRKESLKNKNEGSDGDEKTAEDDFGCDDFLLQILIK